MLNGAQREWTHKKAKHSSCNCVEQQQQQPKTLKKRNFVFQSFFLGCVLCVSVFFFFFFHFILFSLTHSRCGKMLRAHVIHVAVAVEARSRANGCIFIFFHLPLCLFYLFIYLNTQIFIVILIARHEPCTSSTHLPHIDLLSTGAHTHTPHTRDGQIHGKSQSHLIVPLSNTITTTTTSMTDRIKNTLVRWPLVFA